MQTESNKLFFYIPLPTHPHRKWVRLKQAAYLNLWPKNLPCCRYSISVSTSSESPTRSWATTSIPSASVRPTAYGAQMVTCVIERLYWDLPNQPTNQPTNQIPNQPANHTQRRRTVPVCRAAVAYIRVSERSSVCVVYVHKYVCEYRRPWARYNSYEIFLRHFSPQTHGRENVFPLTITTCRKSNTIGAVSN